MKIYFARHGESQANLLNVISNRDLPHHLTQRGYQQAELLADRLHGACITHIYCSPVLRAVETGEIVAEQLGISYAVTDALREYDCGILESRSDQAAWQQWHNLQKAWLVDKKWDECIEGGESFLEVRQRFISFIDGLCVAHSASKSNILCISHGGIYSMNLPQVIKNMDGSQISLNGFDYASVIVAEMRAQGLFMLEWIRGSQ